MTISFSDLFDIIANNTLSRSDLTTIGAVKNIHYGDVLIKFGDNLNAKDVSIPYIKDSHVVRNKDFLHNGDIIIADTAEDSTVGKSTEIYGITDEKIVSGLHTIPVRPRKHFASKYLGYYINSPSYHNQLVALMQGIKVFSISKGNISHTIIAYPNIETQTKIAQMLCLVDRRIETQQKLLTVLKSYKRGLVLQVFSDKSRICQTAKIKDLAHITTGSSNTLDATPNGEYPFFIRSENVMRSAKYIFDGEAVLTIGDGQIGKVFHYINGKFDCHQRVYMITNFASVNARYFYYYFSAFFLNRAKRMSAKNTVDSVRMEMIADMEISYPNINEQLRIATLLDNLDKRIQKETDMGNKLLTLKNALMQQLFI